MHIYRASPEDENERLHDRILLWFIERALIPALESNAGRRLLWSLIVIVLLSSAYGITLLRAGSAPYKFFAIGTEIRDSVNKFREKFDGDSALFIMVDSEEEDGIKDPDFLAKVEQLQHLVMNEQNVGDVMSLLDPLKRVNQVLLGNGKEEYYRLDELRSNEIIAQAILFYDLSGQPGDIDYWTSSDCRYLRLNVWANLGHSSEVAALCKKIYKHAQTLNLIIDVGGELPRWGEPFIHYVVTGKIINLLVCFPFVFICSSLALRSWRLGALAIVPLTFTSLVVFGVMGYLDISLDMTTCTLASFVVFLVVDWSFYFVGRLRQYSISNDAPLHHSVLRTVRLEARPVMIDATTNAGAYLVLTLSSFEPVRVFGWLIALAQIVGSLSTLILLPLTIRVLPALIEDGIRKP
jgi:predicted RND superfamily exporter protein